MKMEEHTIRTKMEVGDNNTATDGQALTKTEYLLPNDEVCPGVSSNRVHLLTNLKGRAKSCRYDRAELGWTSD